MVVAVPSLNWLRVFEAAARCESFARAAAQLNMSPAAVSQQVRALEDRLGQALFVRHAHSVTLTDAGRAYLPSVQQALVTLSSATEGLFGDAQAQQVFVQSVVLFALGVLAAGYKEFTKIHPDISLRLTTAVHVQEFPAQYADVKVVFGNPFSYGAEADFLMGETLYPVASPEIAAGISTPGDLLKHTLIEGAEHRAGWAYLCDHLGVLPGSAHYLYVDNTLIAMALAREGAGIALARSPASDRAMQEAGLVRCLPDGVGVPGREAYHLVYADRSALRPPARAFRNWLLEWCGSFG